MQHSPNVKMFRSKFHTYNYLENTLTSLWPHLTQQALLRVLLAILITLRLSAARLILKPSLISPLYVFRAGTQPQSPEPAEKENDNLRFFRLSRITTGKSHRPLCFSCAVFKAQRGECLFKSFTAYFPNVYLRRSRYKTNNLFQSHAAIISVFSRLWPSAEWFALFVGNPRSKSYWYICATLCRLY